MRQVQLHCGAGELRYGGGRSDYPCKPDSGSSIAQGGFITIWVSTGKEKVAVPNITAGTDYVTAELMLKAVGLKAQANGPTGSTAVVVSINPGAGSQ